MPAPSSPPALPAGYEVPAAFEQGDVQAGDVRLHYWRHGRRGAPQLLVLHGVTDWGLDWARFARRVGDRLDCILLDQRGHGLSDKPEHGYSATEMAGDAVAVIHSLGLGRPAVMGHSMGGSVGLALGALHPDAIGRLLLLDPAIRPTGVTFIRTRAPASELRARLEARKQHSFERILADLRAAQPTWDEEDLRNMAPSKLLVSPAVYSDSPRATPEEQEAQLQRLACPTLIVRGDPAHGGIIPDEAASRIRALTSPELVRLTTIAGTGHCPQRDAFHLFVAVVLPFMTGSVTPNAEGGSPVCFAHLVESALPRT
jgi:pimeloyl-ACP methyl ester carboxylesterase